jgi:hypothetical protein
MGFVQEAEWLASAGPASHQVVAVTGAQRGGERRAGAPRHGPEGAGGGRGPGRRFDWRLLVAMVELEEEAVVAALHLLLVTLSATFSTTSARVSPWCSH